MCEVRPVSGRGLGLVATRDIAPGEVVLSETPVLLYPHHNSLVSAAEAAINFEGLDDELASALLLLVRVISLKTAATAGSGEAQATASAVLAAVASLVPAPESVPFDAEELLRRLPGGHDLTLGDVLGLLRRDAANAYGISLDGGETLRGSVLLATGSRLNHECLPNVARLDAFDDGAPGAGLKHVAFKALHAIPAGEELTQSYFPLHWDLEERQERAVEAGAEARPEDCGGADEGYVGMFLLKYSCPNDACSGTLVPVSARRADVSRCNVCGLQRTDQELYAELDAMA
ncbi:hypothetical protein QBZ16_000396 [Prototheca wickerhamii]|uniref:SET domain-containing protein n=1 Tax=Prototheca wickerhamii TaxID=3111 RepID=A0AAD9ILH3_PROWI|nr:hypothetical protein QBZ16_000396 [Prototheca wickerhamii]